MAERKLWGGFVGGKLAIINVDTGWGGFGNGSWANMSAIFTTRKAASARYQDVRPVTVAAPQRAGE